MITRPHCNTAKPQKAQKRPGETICRAKKQLKLAGEEVPLGYSLPHVRHESLKIIRSKDDESGIVMLVYKGAFCK